MADAHTAVTRQKKDWTGAFRAMRRLLADPGDTVQVFRIMAALNAGTAARNYTRLLQTAEGGRIAFRHEELVDKLTNREWLSQFAPGTVGAAYRAFLARTGFSADGLADVSRQVPADRDAQHPYSWFGRRERDLHDVWHTMTGYPADAPLGELCLVAFTYAQTRGLGWGFIWAMGMLKSFFEPNGRFARRAAWEGYRHGKRAHWLHDQDIDTLFAEPLEAARKRLNIGRPLAYERAQDILDTPPSGWLVPAA